MNRHWILRLFAATLFALCRMFCADAQEAVDMPVDSLEKKPNLISRIIRYFEESNKERPDKKFDVTFLGGPSYSPSTSVQIAAIAAGQYHTRRDSLTPLSNVSAFVQGSISGFYRVGIFGNHFSPSDRFRINYHADFAHFPLKFWGIGYDTESQEYTEPILIWITAQPTSHTMN